MRRRVTRSDAFVGVLAHLAASVLSLHSRTLRIEFDTHPDVRKLDPSRILYGFWHGRQFLLVAGFRNTGIAIMTDLSWAGEIQTRILERYGYATVRGSSRRKAARVLAEMKRTIEAGHPAAFALDGPGGPIHRSKPGILLLARKLGCPIVPVGTSAAHALTLRTTWDRYLFPLPFARCSIVLGAPIEGAADGSLSLDDLDRAVTEVTEKADRRVGRLRDREVRSDGA